MRSKSLSSLADFYKVRVKRRHRALDDAEATAEVFLRFLGHLDLEFGVTDLSDLLAFQYRRYSEVKQISRHLAHIRENVLSELPTSPGVYFMKDSRRRTIYVGKAQNLKNRVRSYFTSIEGHPPRIRKMVRSIRDVEWQETESELEALLLESRLIKKLQPTYNRAQLEYVNRPFVRIETSHAYPRVTWTAFLHDDGAEYYGPLSSRGEAKFVVDVIDRFFQLRECDDTTFSRRQRCVYASIGRCFGPCDGGSGAYAAELDRLRAFLTGQDWSVNDRITEAMKASAADLDYEQAGTYRDWLHQLERILTKRESIASRVLDHNAVVVHRPLQGVPRLLVVSRGRHSETIPIDESAVEDGFARLRQAAERHFSPDVEKLNSYREREIDEVYVLAHWLYVHRREVRHVRWEDGDAPEHLVDRVRLELGAAAGASASRAAAV
jgi:DNA polymerase-3 subunit epsilon